jgi:hypothetical protein
VPGGDQLTERLVLPTQFLRFAIRIDITALWAMCCVVTAMGAIPDACSPGSGPLPVSIRTHCDSRGRTRMATLIMMLRASVGSTEASASILARVGVVGPKHARPLQEQA